MLNIGIALVAALALQGGEAPTAKSLIEKMMNRYHAAQTLSGKMRLTVSAQSGSASMDTELQYERPARLYLKQSKNVSNPDPAQPSQWIVTSDGSTFSYPIPNDKYEASPGVRFVEPVANVRVRTTHTIGSIYAAASKSIGDRSMPLDIAIAARDDLAYRRSQWATYSITGSKEVAGKSAYIVSGDFRPYVGSDVTGKYQMLITADGDLLQYVEVTNVAVGEGASAQVVKLTSQWDVSFVVGGKIDPALFRVIVR